MDLFVSAEMQRKLKKRKRSHGEDGAEWDMQCTVYEVAGAGAGPGAFSVYTIILYVTIINNVNLIIISFSNLEND